MDKDNIKYKKTSIKPNVKKNYVYNIIYQIFLLIVPLVVTPYISRILGPSGIGQYSYSYSLATYFIIVGSLGFGIYAQREIAKVQTDIKKQKTIFWEINICRFVFVGIATLLNLVLCSFNVYGEYNLLMYIFSINIFATAFDIAFYFQGNENFLKLVIRNVAIKTISIIAIFVFVKYDSDVWKYTLINVVMVLISNLSLWFGLGKKFFRFSIKDLKPFRHLVGTLRLFIPTIATSIYTVLDKTLIGILIDGTYTIMDDGIEIVKYYADIENGYYEQTEKIVKMTLAIITSLGVVMIPRNTSEFERGNIFTVKENIYFAARFVFFVSIPICLGIICISANFVPWYYGSGYDKCVDLIRIFSLLVPIIGLSNVFGVQYLVPTGQDNKLSIALISGAAINLVLNLILIPHFWSIGAAIASIIAEFFVTLIMWLTIKKDFSILKIAISSVKYFLSGIIMFFVCWIIQKNLSSSIVNSMIIIIIGILVYLITLIILQDSLVFNILRKIKKIIFKK